MGKGFFSQSACVLLNAPAALDQVEKALAPYGTSDRLAGCDSWEFGGPSV